MQVIQLLTNDTKGLNLLIAETLAGAAAQPVGPFQVDVQDPKNTVTVTPGSDDQKTPTNFKAKSEAPVGARPHCSLARLIPTEQVAEKPHAATGIR